MQKNLEQLIADSGFAAQFQNLGFTASCQQVMEKTDIIVSCSRKEALGRTLLEAILLNKPIIYANDGGPKEIFTDKVHGLAYGPDDYEALGNNIVEIIKNPDATCKRIATARAYVLSNFNVEHYIGAVVNKLRELKGQHRDCNSNAVIDLLDTVSPSELTIAYFRPKLYFAQWGEDFTEDQVIFSEKQKSGKFALEFELPSSGFDCFRLDPTEDFLINFSLYKMTFTGTDDAVFIDSAIEITTNGINTGGNTWRFNTLDPYLTFNVNRPIKKIYICGELTKCPPENCIQELNLQSANSTCPVLSPTMETSSTLYYDCGAGINENDLIRQNVKVVLDYQHLDLSFKLPQAVTCLRFDPVEKYNCAIRRFRITADGIPCNAALINGIHVPGLDIFTTTDPQYLIEQSFGAGAIIRISGELSMFKNEDLVDLLRSTPFGTMPQLPILQQSTFKLFYDCGNGYNEKDVLCHATTPRSGYQRLEMVFILPKAISSFRIDPTEGYYCTVNKLQVNVDGHLCIPQIVNGIRLDDTDLFFSSDPQYIVNETLPEGAIILVSGEFFFSIMPQFVSILNSYMTNFFNAAANTQNEAESVWLQRLAKIENSITTNITQLAKAENSYREQIAAKDIKLAELVSQNNTIGKQVAKISEILNSTEFKTT